MGDTQTSADHWVSCTHRGFVGPTPRHRMLSASCWPDRMKARENPSTGHRIFLPTNLPVETVLARLGKRQEDETTGKLSYSFRLVVIKSFCRSRS